MPTTIAHIYLTWLIGEALNALLRPVFLRAGDDLLRFMRLLNACDCWPYMVAVDGGQLLILTGRDAEDYRTWREAEDDRDY